MSEQAPVFQFDGNDPEMQKAYEKARTTFRYLWRELSWERRRIIPALDMACVKAPFSDGKPGKRSDIEHMWISDVECDGIYVVGKLLNSPNHLKSVKEGDSIAIPINQMSDWMYSIAGEVFGGYTVNLMRLRMNKKDRKEHDAAWGLEFGDPAKVRIYSDEQGPIADHPDDHPMAVNMAPGLKKEVTKDPSLITSTDERGWTLLHHESLAGNMACVKILLKAGADPKLAGKNGLTPIQLARSLGWEKVAVLLESPRV